MYYKNFQYLASVKDLDLLIKGFEDEEVINFIKIIFKKNYERFFVQDQCEALKLVDQTFHCLATSLNNDCNKLDNFNTAVEKVINEVFNHQNENFWFKSRYTYYKSVVKPASFLKILEPRLQGKKILDFGTGRGYFAELLALNGYEVSATDVIDQLSEDVTDLDFRLMPNETTIPFEKGEFDTAVINTVFHHIEREDLSLIFCELSRVAKRLVIVEDMCYFEDFSNYKVKNDIEKKMIEVFLNKFNSFQRLAVCKIIDFYGNALAQGLYYINFPFNFQPVAGWKKMIERHGFNFEEHYPIGLFEKGLHTCFQTVLVFNNLDK